MIRPCPANGLFNLVISGRSCRILLATSTARVPIRISRFISLSILYWRRYIFLASCNDHSPDISLSLSLPLLPSLPVPLHSRLRRRSLDETPEFPSNILYLALFSLFQNVRSFVRSLMIRYVDLRNGYIDVIDF